MATTYNAADVLCPFYRTDDGRQRLRCEGLIPDTSTTVWFCSRKGFRRHMEVYCCARFEYCERYLALMAKYADDEEDMKHEQR